MGEISRISDLTLEELRAIIREEITHFTQPLSIDAIAISRPLTPAQALYVRGQLAAFAEDWDDSSMDIYDNLSSE